MKRVSLTVPPLIVFTGLVLAGLASSQASAATVYWGGGTGNIANGTVLNPATGNWNNTVSNWGNVSTGAANYSVWTAGDTANFGTTAAGYTISQNAAITLGGLSTYTFSGNGAGTVTINGVGAGLTISSNASLNVGTGHMVALSYASGTGGVSSGNFSKDGGGILTITMYNGGTSTAGTVNVNDGIIRFGGNANNFGNQAFSLNSNTAYLEINQNSIASGLAGVQVGSFIGSAGTIRTTNANNGILRLISTANFTFGGTLANGATGGTLSFNKDTAGKVTLTNGANSNTGFTNLWNGTWESAGAGAGSGKIALFGAGLAGARTAGTYQNTGNGTLSAVGTVTAFYSGVIKGYNLSVDDLNTRVQVLSGGLLQYDAAGDIAGTGRVLGGASAGAILGAGYAMDNAFLQRVKTGFNGTVALAADSSNDLDFSSDSGLNSAATRLGAVGGARSYSGTLTPNAGTYMLGGGTSKLTLSNTLVDSGGSLNLDVGSDALFGQFASYYKDPVNYLNVGGAAGIDTSSVAHPILTANNTFSGTTAVSGYAVLELSGANGALSGTSGVTLNRGGVLYLKDQSGATNADRLNDSATLTVNQGGQLTFNGTGGNIEWVGALNLNSGQLLLSSNRTSGAGNATLLFSSLSRSTGSTLRNVVGANSLINFVTPLDTGGNNSTLGGWAASTGNATAITGNWTTYAGTTLGTLATYTTTANTTWTATDNVSLTANATTYVAVGSQTIYSLRNTGGTLATLDLNGLNLTIDGGGLMQTTAGTFTIQNGTLTAGAPMGGGNYELFFWGTSGGRNFTVAATAAIADNGANPVAVVKAGYSTASSATGLTLSGNNSYSGGTYINSGTVTAGNDQALGAGPVYFNGVSDNGVYLSQYNLSTLNLTGAAGNHTLANDLVVNADAVLNGSAGAVVSNWVITGNVTLNNQSTLKLLSTNATATFGMNGTITGTGGLGIWASAGSTLTIGGSGNNTYTGDTLVVGEYTMYLAKSGGNAIGGNLYIGGYMQDGGTPNSRLVQLNLSDQIADTGLVTLAGGGTAGVSLNILRLNGNSDTVGGLAATLGNGIVENNKAASTSTLILNPEAGQSCSFGGLLRDGAGAAGILKIFKSGAGVQTLTGNNTLTGGVSVIGGSLLINNSVGSGSGTGTVSVYAGGTLGGTGFMVPTGANVLTIFSDGILAPGANNGVIAGPLTVNLGSTSGGAALLSGATMQYELGAPGQSDLLQFYNYGTTGGRILSLDPGGNTVNFTSLAGFGEGTYTLFQFYADAGTTLTDTGKPLSGLLVGSGISPTYNALFDYSPIGQINLVVTLVPEPGTLGLLAFGSLAILPKRRKRKHG